MPISPELAHKLAGYLTTIPDCPRSDEAIDVLARDLLKHCVDENEAKWVVDEAREHWPKWKGTVGLIDLLETKRHPPALRPERHVQPRLEELYGPKPPTECDVCNDTGYVWRDGRNEWCACSAGASLSREFPDLVEKLNKRQIPSPFRKEPTPIRKVITEADIQEAFEKRQDRSEEMIREARATLQPDSGASKDQIEIAREILRGFGAEEAS